MKLDQTQIEKEIENIRKKINSVNTTLIEIILPQDIPMQSWHHYESANVNYEPESEEVIFSFYINNKRTSGFVTKLEAIRLYRLLELPETPQLGMHFHMLVSDNSVDIKVSNKSNEFSIIRRKDYPLFCSD